MWVGMGLGPRTTPLLPDAYRRLLDDPGTVEGNVRGHGSASVDSELDDAIVRPAPDRPVLVPKAGRGPPLCYGDVLEVWRPWAQTSGAERSTLALPGR